MEMKKFIKCIVLIFIVMFIILFVFLFILVLVNEILEISEGINVIEKIIEIEEFVVEEISNDEY